MEDGTPVQTQSNNINTVPLPLSLAEERILAALLQMRFEGAGITRNERGRKETRVYFEALIAAVVIIAVFH
jgi:hypothetical protein